MRLVLAALALHASAAPLAAQATGKFAGSTRPSLSRRLSPTPHYPPGPTPRYGPIALRQRFHGRDAYDFAEGSLNAAALRVGRAGKYDDAFALLRLNEELFPNSASTSVFRGNITLLKGDTTAAEAAFREALRRDPSSHEARARLRAIGRQP